MADDTELGFDALTNTINTPHDLDDSDVDLSALGQAMDTTWGRSSTPRTHQNSVKFTIEGNTLVASFSAIIRFGDERQMIEAKRRYADESVRVINANIAAVKSRYKDLSDSTLKTKELTTTDSLEIIGVNFYNPCRTAYYRRKTVYEFS